MPFHSASRTSTAMRSRALRVLSLTGLLLASGCLPFLRPATAPMRTVRLPAPVEADCLAVLLPGRFGRPSNFVRARFREAADERGLAVDLIAVDAHLGYYRDRSILDRLHEDVLAPARAEGYREVWIVGASLGGLGALLYARDRPEDLQGILAIAPFLGDDELIEEIRSQGGARSWSPDPATAEEDFPRLWRWLRSRTEDAVPLHLAFGTEDRFAPAGRLLAELLPDPQVHTTAGGHDWKVWAGLWREFLGSGALCSPEGAPAP